MEVFANDRQAAVSAGKYVPENLVVRLFSNGGDILVKQVKCWKMKSIYPGGVKGQSGSRPDRTSYKLESWPNLAATEMTVAGFWAPRVSPEQNW